LKFLTGQTTYVTKQQTKPYNKSLRKSPTCLAIRALLCCVCMSESLSGTNIPNGRTNIPTTTNNIPIATPQRKSRSNNMDSGAQHTRRKQTWGHESSDNTDARTEHPKASRPKPHRYRRKRDKGNGANPP
jgi:hypothetical protein